MKAQEGQRLLDFIDRLLEKVKDPEIKKELGKIWELLITKALNKLTRFIKKKAGINP